jgi:hypothetical protein
MRMLSTENVQGFTPQGGIGYLRLAIGGDFKDRMNRFPIDVLLGYSLLVKRDIRFAWVN